MTEPFSEPESTALGSLIQRVNPVAVLFYHSAANGVYAGSCDGSSVSDDLAELYGTASGYPYGEEFSAYTVTGTAPSWVDSIGIPSLDIELATATGTEFSRNFEAIQAVQQWATFKAFRQLILIENHRCTFFANHDARRIRIGVNNRWHN